MKWQADGKRRHDYDLIIAQTVFISDTFAGQFDPIKSNPYREIEPVPLSEYRKKKQADNGIKALGVMLRQMKKSKKKR